MAAKNLQNQDGVRMLPTVAGSTVPTPGDGPVLFADSSNGNELTGKLPDGSTIVFGATGITRTTVGGATTVLGSAYMTDAKVAGALGDVVETEATIVALEDTAVVADALSQADVGKVISIEEAGDGADLVTTITAVSADGLTVTLADAAVDGATDAVTFVGTSDVASLTASDEVAEDSTLLIPPGVYLIDDDLTLAAATVKVMRGASFVVLEGFTLDFTGFVEAAPNQIPVLLYSGALGAVTRTVPNTMTGAGSPAAAVSGVIGDVWQANDGTTDTTLWRKEAGHNNTSGWVAVEAP